MPVLLMILTSIDKTNGLHTEVNKDGLTTTGSWLPVYKLPVVKSAVFDGTVKLRLSILQPGK